MSEAMFLTSILQEGALAGPLHSPIVLENRRPATLQKVTANHKLLQKHSGRRKEFGGLFCERYFS